MAIEQIPPATAESIAFKAGREAAAAGVELKNSALCSLHPESKQYADFIAGYDSPLQAAGRHWKEPSPL